LYDGLKLNLTLAAYKVEINVANGEWDLIGKFVRWWLDSFNDPVPW